MASKSKDTEITLDVFKLLALFFGLVALCGVFFGLGYAWGNKSAKSVDRESLAQTVVVPAERPSAGKLVESAQNAPSNPAAPKSSDDSSTKSKAPKPPATATEIPPTEPSDSSATAAAQTAALSGGSYFVQVAAVSKQEDAEALVDALKRKQYPALISGTSTDKLFHVQLGPYPDLKDAETMRAKLTADGYNPIVKK